jgi:hypothetical protein
MAGAALTTPLAVVDKFDVLGTFSVKSAEVVNEGDLVSLDSNGQVVVANATSAGVQAMGVAFMVGDDAAAGTTYVTGVAALTKKVGIARQARVSGFSSLTVGGRVYLDAAPTGGADNYKQTYNSDEAWIQLVGIAKSATEVFANVVGTWFTYEATSGSLWGEIV